jgi:hypothetical protein
LDQSGSHQGAASQLPEKRRIRIRAWLQPCRKIRPLRKRLLAGVDCLARNAAAKAAIFFSVLPAHLKACPDTNPHLRHFMPLAVAIFSPARCATIYCFLIASAGRMWKIPSKCATLKIRI